MHPPCFFALFWFLFFYILEIELRAIHTLGKCSILTHISSPVSLEIELGAMHILGKCSTLTHISSPVSCTANHLDVTHSAKYTMNAVQMTIILDWVGNRGKGKKSTCIQMGLCHIICSTVC